MTKTKVCLIASSTALTEGLEKRLVSADWVIQVLQVSDWVKEIELLPQCEVYAIFHSGAEEVERIASAIRATPNLTVSTAAILWVSPERNVSIWPSPQLDDVLGTKVTRLEVLARIRARITQASERRQRAQQMLENAKSETILKQREEFLGVCAHDLRSPLGLIKAGLGMVLGESPPLSNVHRELLTRAERQSRHALVLVEDLLDVMAYEQGLRPDYQLVGLDGFLREFFQDYRLQAEQKGIRFEFQSEIANWQVLIDPDRVRQLLQNLFANAVKFTPEGRSIYLRVDPFQGRRKADPPFPMVMLTLRDEGSGISKKDLEGVFNRFTQAKGMGRSEGRGLGLSVAKQIAQLHDGNVWASSEPGKGSSFYVMFPHVVGAIARAPASVPRVLIVAPGGALGSDFEAAMARAGITPIRARDGVEGVTLAHYHSPEIVLFYSDLTKLSAVEAAQIIQKRLPARRILITSGDTAHTVQSAVFDDVLTPSLVESELSSWIKSNASRN